MEPGTRKIVLPMIVAFAACLVVTAVIIGPGRSEVLGTTAPQTEAEETLQLADEAAGDTAPTEETPPPAEEAPAVVPDEPVTPSEVESAVPTTSVLPEPEEREGGWGALRARAPTQTLKERGSVSSIGSLDPLKERVQIEFSDHAAGISRIVFSDFWRTGAAKRQAAAHQRARAAGSDDPPPLPAEDLRYVLQTSAQLATANGVTLDTPILAVHSIRVRGWGDSPIDVVLFGDVWSEVSPGIFESEVVEETTGTVVLKLRRSFVLPQGRFDVSLDQIATNISQYPLAVQWRQYGPGDLIRDETAYIGDMRRFHFGYLFNTQRDPQQAHVMSQGMMVERGTVISMAEEFSQAIDENRLWPSEAAIEDGLTLSWFGATSRYFTLCIHAPFDPPLQPSKQLVAVSKIEPVLSGPSGSPDDQTLLTSLHGPEYTIDPGQNASWNMGVYAGPLERTILRNQQPYKALNMGGLILYLMSGCCSFCTFAWLADLMIVFLSWIDGIVLDWGVSIIILVIVVRLLLHPITRKGQVSMQRSAKAMGELKPELDQLKKRYGDDAEKMRKEQMRLMQEKGVNPLGCASGMLPMFLQMPIWIALYAVLFFAFELRQQWAFYGFFQMFDGWSFLGDLSAPDNFINLGVNYDILFFQFTGINLLPILMGIVFFIQQKYMTPPPTTTMSEDQLRQQKMMKVMMLVLFPVMLYGAPSGLTLYILTSSVIGTMESRYIRKHLTKMDERAASGDGDSPKDAEKAERAKKRQDRIGKMYEQMLDNARTRQEKKKQKQKTFKKRS